MVYALKRNSDVDTGFVTRFFEEYYHILLGHLKDCQSSLTSKESAEDMIPGDADAVLIKKVQDVLNDLYNTLESQSLLAAQKGGEFAISYYREAQYVMAALTDELFLNIPNWKGKQYWNENLLESRLFGTHDAGGLFFSKLDEFLEERDPLRRDVAEVYLLALGVGFQGKYRGMPDQRQLDSYRHQLYVFINHQEPRFYQGHDRLFSQAYSHTLTEGTPRRFQDMRFWSGAFASVFGVLLLVSFVVWHNLTGDIEHLAEDILINSSAMDRGL